MQRLKRPTLRSILRWAIVPVVSFVLVVAVAMACAVWSPVGTWGIPFGPLGDSMLEIPRAVAKYDGEFLFGADRSGIGISHYIVDTDVMVLRSGHRELGYVRLHVGTSGFPYHCLRWTHANDEILAESIAVTRGIELRQSANSNKFQRRIPLMPEPVGMVLNVLIYSAVIVVCRLAWRRLVVRRRKRKGLCLNCAYPVEPSAANCPECGGAYARAVEADAAAAGTGASP